MTLSTTSIAETPGVLPAPEIAWREVITIDSRPKLSWMGLRVMQSPTVVQFG